MRKQRKILKNQADLAIFCGQISGRVGHNLIIQENPTGLQALQPGRNAKHGGLTTARWAQETNQFTGIDRQRQIVDGRERPKSVANTLKAEGGHVFFNQ